MIRLLLLGLALALPAAAAAEQLYRWVDKDGTVRYSDRPPPGGVPSRTLNVPGPAPAAEDKGSAGSPSLQDQAKAFEKRQEEQKKAADKAAAASKDEQIKADNCRRARESLATLQGGRRIMQTDAQGNQYYIDDAQRAQEAERAEQAVKEWCN
ncbi:MAG TPA: DUF4124 domain-containing protein [Burkholderiales bacterium]|nr:DUF4124 domain-containing protein [Burkholderiales bacterium]